MFVRGDTAYYKLESIFRAFKRKEMKASRRLAENDIITRGVTVKIQQVAVRGNYANRTNLLYYENRAGLTIFRILILLTFFLQNMCFL
jgi:hypothetical protein